MSATAIWVQSYGIPWSSVAKALQRVHGILAWNARGCNWLATTISVGLRWLMWSHVERAKSKKKKKTLHHHWSPFMMSRTSAPLRTAIRADILIFYSPFWPALCSKYLLHWRVFIAASNAPRLIPWLCTVCFYIEPIQKLTFPKKPLVISDISLYLESL